MKTQNTQSGEVSPRLLSSSSPIVINAEGKPAKLCKASIRHLVLENHPDLFKEYAKAHRSAFLEGDDAPLDNLRALYGCEVSKEILNMNDARYKRGQRVKNRIEQGVADGLAWFVTLTFTDKALEDTEPQSRRKQVCRVCKSIGPYGYIANIDYGDKAKNPTSKEREHYHALIFTYEDKETLTKALKAAWGDKYGFFSLKHVKPTEADSLRTSKYVAKLSHHAMKQDKNGRAPRIIYSRGLVGLPF